MSYSFKISTLSLVGAVLSVLTACTDEDISYKKPSDTVRFSVNSTTESADAKSRALADNNTDYLSVTSSEDNSGSGNFYLHAVGEDVNIPQTRGASVNSVDGKSISITAFAFDDWDDSLTPNFMVEEELSSPWETDRYWPNTGKKLQFFSHCPYRIEGWQRIDEPGYPKYSYQVPAEAAKQSDILVAATSELDDKSKSAVSLNFRHALTRIKFSAAPDFESGTIHSITLKGAAGAGVFSFADMEWCELGAPADFENSINHQVSAEGGNLLPDELTFIMIPQTFGSDSEASVEISFTDTFTGTDHKLSFALKGHQWAKGKTVNYRLSTNPDMIVPVFELEGSTEAQEVSVSHLGEDVTRSVASYARVISPGIDKYVPLDWEIEKYNPTTGQYESLDAAAADWFKAQSAADNANAGFWNLNISAQAQTPIVFEPNNERLRNATPLSGIRNLANHTEASYFDLTTNEETANCYIVNSAGTYSFPIVYGNAIKNSSANQSSYTSTKIGSNFLQTFKNARGEGITCHEIEKDLNLKVSDAVLLWQDYPSLIHDIRVIHDESPIARVEFSVCQSDIGQGNAVIAVRDNMGEILWSWHIWVTDYDPYTSSTTFFESTNDKGKTFKITTQNLGWCEGVSSDYPRRDEQLRLKQSGTSRNITVTLVQNEYRSKTIGNNTYYQYCRKDPMLGASDYKTDKQCYTEFDKYRWSHRVGATTIQEGIRYPYLSFPSGTSNHWLKSPDNRYSNLWNTSSTFIINSVNNYGCTPAVKSIYDPCPPGLVIPAPGDLSKLVSIGLDWDGNNVGATTKTAPKIFFPATGYRDIYASVAILIKNKCLLARVWSWGSPSNIDGWHLCVTSNLDNALNTTYYMHYDKCYCCSGLPVRPVCELSSDIWK